MPQNAAQFSFQGNMRVFTRSEGCLQREAKSSCKNKSGHTNAWPRSTLTSHFNLYGTQFPFLLSDKVRVSLTFIPALNTPGFFL